MVLNTYFLILVLGVKVLIINVNTCTLSYFYAVEHIQMLAYIRKKQ